MFVFILILLRSFVINFYLNVCFYFNNSHKCVLMKTINYFKLKLNMRGIRNKRGVIVCARQGMPKLITTHFLTDQLAFLREGAKRSSSFLYLNLIQWKLGDLPVGVDFKDGLKGKSKGRTYAMHVTCKKWTFLLRIDK